MHLCIYTLVIYELAAGLSLVLLKRVTSTYLEVHSNSIPRSLFMYPLHRREPMR